MDELTSLVLDEALPEFDLASAQHVRERSLRVLRPIGALARLDELAAWLAGWQRTTAPAVESPALLLFAADHGVAAAGVSAYPAEVTRAMLEALRSGVATANVMADTVGAKVWVVDVGVGEPTGDIGTEPAMTPERFMSCWRAGRAAVGDLAGADLLVLGEMGIGNTTAAAAVCASLFGGAADLWTGPGTGIDDAAMERKKAVVRAAQRRLTSAPPLEVLRQAGGAELVAISAAVLEARLRSIPVLLDGYVVGASCAPLEKTKAGTLAHTRAGHCSAEPGHRRLLEILGLDPLLDLGLRLGEGTGALAAVPLVRLAARCVTGVATFEEWPM